MTAHPPILASSPPLKTGAVVHRFAHQAPSIEYRAWVDGKEAYVFHLSGFAGGTISWILLDLHEAVEILISPHRQVDEARVLPRRAQRNVTLFGNCAAMRIDHPGSYLLEWDGGLELPFFVFARPPAPPSSSPLPSGRRVVLGPGEHRPGRIELHSGDELHLAPGAEVYGAISARGAVNIRITGCGTLRQSHLPFGGTASERQPIELIDCRDVIIDGPVLVDGCTWNVVLRNCDHVQIRNLTIFSERRYSTDGINPCDSRHVLIEDCFVRCKDDCISVKGLQRKTPVADLKPISDIEVRNCLFWSDNNNGLVVGTETWAAEICRIRFHAIDFVRVSGTCGDWAAAFAVQALADTHVHDIVFEDIEVESCTGNPFAIFFLDEVYGIIGQRREGGGLIDGITFRNITFHQPIRRRSFIQGMDARRRVGEVRFSGVVSGSKSVTGPEDLRLQTNEFAGPVRFDAAD